jgi:hypothetical protein
MPKEMPDTRVSTKRHRYASSDTDTNAQGVSPVAIGKASVSKLRFSDENPILETEGKTRCCK